MKNSTKKKYLIFALILGLAIGIFFFYKPLTQAVFSGGCTPSTGYDYCNYATNTVEDATAQAKIEITKLQGVEKGTFATVSGWPTGKYYVGDAYINVKYSGTSLTYSKGLTSAPKCNDAGCPGEQIDSGKVTLASPGQEYFSSPYFMVWTYKASSTGAWTWVTQGNGYLNKAGGIPTFAIRSVGCYDNSDCDASSWCNKNGDWQSWSCKQKECTTIGVGEQKSGGYYICQGNWTLVRQGECKLADTTCSRITYSIASNDYQVCEKDNVTGLTKWVNKGIIKGKCDNQCAKASDCGVTGSLIEEKYCSTAGNVLQTNITYVCEPKYGGLQNSAYISPMTCKNSTAPQLLKECTNGCNLGACKLSSSNNTITGDSVVDIAKTGSIPTSTTIIIGSTVVVVLLGGIAFFLIKK
jgi:hypothetical protein